MMTPTRHNNVPGYLLAGLGLCVCGVELGRYWLDGAPLEAVPMAIAAILFFVGGALIDVKKATEIAGVVVSSGVTILQALPGIGRRGYDRSPPVPSPVLVAPATTMPADAVIIVPGASTAPTATDDESA